MKSHKKNISHVMLLFGVSENIYLDYIIYKKNSDLVIFFHLNFFSFFKLLLMHYTTIKDERKG